MARQDPAANLRIQDLEYYAGLHARVAGVIPAVRAEQGAGVSLVAFGQGGTVNVSPDSSMQS